MNEAVKQYADACINVWKGVCKAFAELTGIDGVLKWKNYGPHTNNWRRMHGLPMRRRPEKKRRVRPIARGHNASFVIVDEIHEYRG